MTVRLYVAPNVSTQGTSWTATAGRCASTARRVSARSRPTQTRLVLGPRTLQSNCDTSWILQVHSERFNRFCRVNNRFTECIRCHYIHVLARRTTGTSLIHYTTHSIVRCAFDAAVCASWWSLIFLGTSLVLCAPPSRRFAWQTSAHRIPLASNGGRGSTTW